MGMHPYAWLNLFLDSPRLPSGKGASIHGPSRCTGVPVSLAWASARYHLACAQFSANLRAIPGPWGRTEVIAGLLSLGLCPALGAWSW